MLGRDWTRVEESDTTLDTHLTPRRDLRCPSALQSIAFFGRAGRGERVSERCEKLLEYSSFVRVVVASDPDR